MKIQLLNALSNKVIEKEIVLATGSRSGLRSGSTNADGNVIIGPFATGEEISVQVSTQGLFVTKPSSNFQKPIYFDQTRANFDTRG